MELKNRQCNGGDDRMVDIKYKNNYKFKRDYTILVEQTKQSGFGGCKDSGINKWPFLFIKKK